MENANPVQGYQAVTVGEGQKLRPVDFAIWLSNKKEGVTIKGIGGVKEDGKAVEKFISEALFYHVANTYKRESFDKEKECTLVETSEYIYRTDIIRAKEYGKKFFTGTVDELEALKLNPAPSSTICVHALMEIGKPPKFIADKERTLYRVIIFTTASIRNLMFDNKMQDGSIFKIKGRATTEPEKDDRNFGKYIFEFNAQDGEAGKDYTNINKGVKKFAGQLSEYFDEKGLGVKPEKPAPAATPAAAMPAETARNIDAQFGEGAAAAAEAAPTAIPTPPANDDDDDLPF